MAVRVYAIWSHPLFRDVAVAILSHPDIVWVGDSSNVEKAAEDVAVLMPNIILVEDEEMLLKAVSTFPIVDRVTLIGFNMENDNLVLFHQEKHLIQDVEEIRDMVINLSGSP